MKRSTLLYISVLFITLYTIQQWSRIPFGNTVFWWTLNSLTLYLFISSKRYYFDKQDENTAIFVKIFLVYNVLSIVYGFFQSLNTGNYWHWKFLFQNGFYLLLPSSVFVFTNPQINRLIFTKWFKYALPAFFIFVFFINVNAIGRYLSFIGFLLLFLPHLKRKDALIVIFFTGIVLLSGWESRGNMLKFIIPLLFSGTLLFRFLRSKFSYRLIWFILMFSPVLLIGLGVSGAFNVFKTGELLGIDKTTTNTTGDEIREINLNADTRTFLYVENIISAIDNRYLLFGRSPSRGYDTDAFSRIMNKTYGVAERPSCEVSILNHFTWTGIIGVLLYSLVFLQTSYLALFKSKNMYLKIIGIYIAFRWLFAWLEDFSRLDLNMLVLWICIGMAISAEFRNMTDREFRIWINSLISYKPIVHK